VLVGLPQQPKKICPKNTIDHDNQMHIIKIQTDSFGYIPSQKHALYQFSSSCQTGQEKVYSYMSQERSLTVLAIALIVGFNLVMLSASPIIDSSLRAQIQTYQVMILILAAVMVCLAGFVVMARKRLSH